MIPPGILKAQVPSPPLVIGITGASGALYGVRLLEVLRAAAIETHLVLTAPAEITLRQETAWSPEAVRALATHIHDPGNLAAPIASGSCPTLGMLVAPCSIHTLSAIAHSHASNLLLRAADVTLKEGRPLLLMVRETPLHLGHLRLLVQAAELGAIIFPPVPALYNRPNTIEELVNQTVGRMLARIGIPNALYPPWEGGNDNGPSE